MALLHLLHQLSAEHHWKIVVAHFNHQLRGRSSDADEKLVRKAAAALKLPVRVGQGDVKAFAKKHGLSIEMAARKLRHDFLARLAKESKIPTIALAHHADDQVELFFLRLLRGSGGEGLAGMERMSPSPVDAKITLVRPLLDQSKEALRKFAEENKIHFREDATNASLDFQRNRIRNELLPLLKKYQPAFATNIVRSMEIVGGESEFTLESAREWLAKLRRRTRPTSFSGLPIAVQRQVLLLQLRELAIEPDFDLIEQLRFSQRPVSISSRQTVSRDAVGRIHRHDIQDLGFQSGEQAIILSQSSEASFGGLQFKWRFEKRELGGGVIRLTEKYCEYFDAAKIGGTVTLRYWRPGDRFQPIGMKALVKLQDLFVNLKIPRLERRRKIVALAENGEIFWVEGVRISECFKLDNRTQTRLKWFWRSLNRTSEPKNRENAKRGLEPK